MIAHLTADQLARGVTAAALAFLGILQILRPGCLWGMGMYFAGARAAFSPDQRERLARVLAARTEVEGDTDAFTRYAGFFTIAMAAVALVPSVPYVLPYAASCSATAVAILCIYLHFRRATTRRVAPFVHRTPWTSLSPLALVTVAVCILGAAAFATLPQYRVGGIIVVVTAIALCAIAWRVAIAPAILFGDDPQLEYLVQRARAFLPGNEPGRARVRAADGTGPSRRRRAPSGCTLLRCGVRGRAGGLRRRNGREFESATQAARTRVSGSFVFVNDSLESPPYRQVFEQVRAAIERGELPPGAVLPTVRRLADDLNVAPNTVARAYSELQVEGWLVSDGRRGTRVAPSPPASGGRERTRTLRDAIAKFLDSLRHRGFTASEIAGALQEVRDG